MSQSHDTESTRSNKSNTKIDHSLFPEAYDTENMKRIRSKYSQGHRQLDDFIDVINCKDMMETSKTTLDILYREKEEFKKNRSFRSQILQYTSMVNFEVSIRDYNRIFTRCSDKIFRTDVILKTKAVNTMVNPNKFIHQKRNMMFGTHPRLGCNSVFQLLDEDTIKIIASFLEPNITDEFDGLSESQCERWLEYARERKLIK